VRRGPYRKSLTKAQLNILIALYKFRFVSVDLTVEWMGLKTRTHSFNRLKSLEQQGYIARRYTNQDRIDRKPAVYFALNGAINILKQRTELDKTALNTMYKDKLAGKLFIDRCLLTFAVFNRFKAGYGNKALDFFSKREMSRYDFFPKPLPDAYITIAHKGKHDKSKPKADTQYFLELFDLASPFFVHRRVLNKHMSFYDSGEWEEQMETDYPSLLLVCETTQLQKRIQKLSCRLQDSEGAYMSIYTTSTKALLTAGSANEKIWANIDEPEELVGLVRV